jgi:hypothetical protein
MRIGEFEASVADERLIAAGGLRRSRRFVYDEVRDRRERIAEIDVVREARARLDGIARARQAKAAGRPAGASPQR